MCCAPLARHSPHVLKSSVAERMLLAAWWLMLCFQPAVLMAVTERSSMGASYGRRGHAPDCITTTHSMFTDCLQICQTMPHAETVWLRTGCIPPTLAWPLSRHQAFTIQVALGFSHAMPHHLHHSDTHTLQIVLQIVQVKEEMPFPKHPAVIRLSGAELLRGLEEPIAGFGTGEGSEHKFNETGPYGYGWECGMWMYVVRPQIDSFNMFQWGWWWWWRWWWWWTDEPVDSGMPRLYVQDVPAIETGYIYIYFW